MFMPGTASFGLDGDVIVIPRSDSCIVLDKYLSFVFRIYFLIFNRSHSPSAAFCFSIYLA